MVYQPLTSLEKFFSAACGVGEGGDGECGDVCGEGEDSGGGSWLAAEWLQLVVAVQGRVVRGSLHQSTNQPHTTPTTSYYTTPTTSYYTTLPTSNYTNSINTAPTTSYYTSATSYVRHLQQHQTTLTTSNYIYNINTPPRTSYYTSNIKLYQQHQNFTDKIILH